MMTEKEALALIVKRMTERLNDIKRQESLMKNRTPTEMHCLLDIPKRVTFTTKEVRGLSWLTWLIHNGKIGGPNDGQTRQQNQTG